MIALTGQQIRRLNELVTLHDPNVLEVRQMDISQALEVTEYAATGRIWRQWLITDDGQILSLADNDE